MAVRELRVAPKSVLTMLPSMKPQQKGSSGVGPTGRGPPPKARMSSCHVCTQRTPDTDDITIQSMHGLNIWVFVKDAR